MANVRRGPRQSASDPGVDGRGVLIVIGVERKSKAFSSAATLRGRRVRVDEAGTFDRLFSEDQIAERSGLPGPLVDELLSHSRVGPMETRDRRAQVYPFVSLVMAQIAVCMFRVGISYPFVRLSMRLAGSESAEEALESLALWRQHPGLRRDPWYALLRKGFGHGQR